MALSNWDTLAINNDGKSCDGSCRNDLIEIEIYKNFAYIRSPKMWQESGGFTKPTIMQIIQGNIDIGGMGIIAKRDNSQNSIFVFADYSYYEGKEKQPKYFAGIGCSAYYTRVKEYLEWKGLDYKYDEYTTGWTNYDIKNDTPRDYEYIHLSKNGKYFKDKDGFMLEIEIDPAFGELTIYTGVMNKTIQSFKKWLKTDIIDKYDKDKQEWFNKINWKNLSRFNQGDAFFVGEDNSNTKVGMQEKETIMEKIIKKT